MLHVYVNYPNPHMTIHGDSNCKFIRPTAKTDRRISSINVATLSEELVKFAERGYTFAPNPKQNDIWLDIDFGDAEFENAVAGYVLRSLGSRYKPFRDIKPTVHC